LPGYAGLSKGFESASVAPPLIKRALDDLNAIAEAARRVDGIELALLGRLDGLAAQVERLRDEMDPLKQLSEVRSHSKRCTRRSNRSRQGWI
jgi:hypothetical protein